MPGRRIKVQRNVSLPPEHVRAIVAIAADEGHQNVSRVVQDLIERHMRQEVGRDWRMVIERPPEREPALEAIPA